MQVIALIALAVASFPSSTPDVHAYRVAVTPQNDPSAAVASQDVAPPTDGAQLSVTFPDIAPGDWTVHASAVDAAGNVFGPVMTANFNVPQPDVQRVVPTSITVTLS